MFELFLACLEEMRCRYEMRVYGYVVMPEHVHLLLSEPTRAGCPRSRAFSRPGVTNLAGSWVTRTSSQTTALVRGHAIVRKESADLGHPPMAASDAGDYLPQFCESTAGMVGLRSRVLKTTRKRLLAYECGMFAVLVDFAGGKP